LQLPTSNFELPTPRGLFITGTGTEVGKTYVTALLARALVAQGKRVGVYKPVASGCREAEGRRISDDAMTLWRAAGEPLTPEQVCPQRFLAPLAPNIAAAAEGKRVDESLLRIGIDPWLDACDVVLVEGAGGLLSPLSDNDFNVDLAADLGFPLVIVAPNRLGTINDTLQTAVVASVWDERLSIAGVILNQSRPEMDGSCATNAVELRRHLRVPVLAEVAWGGGLDLDTSNFKWLQA
jgi:dethiobiotin synthetase